MPKPANKKTISVDVDDVIAMHAQAFVDYSNKRWGTNLHLEDYTDHWHQIWQTDDAETKRRIGGYLSSGSFSNYRTVKDARNVLLKLKKHHKLVVLTSRQKSLSGDTITWIQKNFPDIFDEIHFSGVWDLPEAEAIKRDKTAVAQEIKTDYLIEDLLKYAIPAADAGIEVLLFGDYPWNQADELPKNVIRVKDWQEVLEYFDGRS